MQRDALAVYSTALHRIGAREPSADADEPAGVLYLREKEAFDRICMSEHRRVFCGLAPVVRVVVGNALAWVLHRLQELEGLTVRAAEYRAQKASELMDVLVRYLHE